MCFEISHKDRESKARAGKIHTDHGPISTPIFMPVGTGGTVKAVHQHELKTVVEADVILGNTYHLYLRPGTEVLKGAGGLHKFISWDRPILTDSGGYQVYSLAHRRKISEEGVSFSSHIDGSSHKFTPENVVDIQRDIGADFVMAFDECPPFPSDRNYTRESMLLTHRWFKRCAERFDNSQGKYEYHQELVPIAQGGTYPELRKQSAYFVAEQGRRVNAIGGLSVGEPKDLLFEMTEISCSIFPESQPRYLMGVGKPSDILECISLGVDLFDCVLPTRNARHGLLYTWDGIINIKNLKWKQNFEAIDERVGATSRSHSKAYLRHLFVSKEILGAQLATLHNLSFYLQLVKEARVQILNNSFKAWKDQLVGKLDRRL